MILVSGRSAAGRQPSSKTLGLRGRGLGAAAFLATAAWLLLAACQTPPAPGAAPTAPAAPAEPAAPAGPALVKLSPSEAPAFRDDLDYEGLDRAISASLDHLRTLPPERLFAFGADRFTARDLARSLVHFQTQVRLRPPAANLRKFLRTHYWIYRSVGRDGRGEVLFTGYYEPQIKGSRVATPAFRCPIYARPEDLLTIDLGAFSEKYAGEKLVGRLAERTIVPYYERREIDAEGAVYGKARVLAWVADPVELFFLHVQGSGRILFEDGGVLYLNYDTGNGWAYRSIGQLLIEEGRIPREEVSMQRIRSYLDQHPEEIARVLNANPSYVFFKASSEGPMGSLNVRLTPGRSLALDRRSFPPAAPAFVEARKPVTDGAGKVTAWVEFGRFMLNQDTGAAIQGPGRADIFWGTGPYAETAAGHLRHPGRLYFFVLRPDAALP